VTAGQETQDDADALAALVSLGFTAKDAKKSLAEIDSSLPLEQRITQALQSISRRK
jgi:Holliday junction resolvasome RuvABC DNA-binding subunit